ncbi:MAG: beta-galactosidase GalA [Flavobacteriaceae bacterium]|nr:beta-galactosidase GalA [Flavobacteriaceae bacterium]
MRTHLVAYLCFLILPLQTFSQASYREKINFDENWRFHFGHASDPAKDFNYGVANIFSKTGKTDDTPMGNKFDDSKWRSLDLPHDWAVELPFVNSENRDVMSHGYKPVGGLFPETSIGWYRKSFEIKNPLPNERYEIQFDGIFRDAEIWINGFYLGNNKSGYIGVTYDVSDYLNFDKENILVVRVDATQYEGWFYEGAGIYRHVWLLKHHAVFVPSDDVFVHTKMKGEDAEITVETNVHNTLSEDVAYTLQTVVTDRDNKILTQTDELSLDVSFSDQNNSKQKLNLSKPRLWSLEDPYLYKVKSIIRYQGKIIDEVTTRFGVRTLAFDAQKGFFLNGKHVKIQGVNNHQDHAGVGSALPDYLHYYRVKLMKEMGINSYRASHNPPAPELLEACDSLGILVMDETRLLNSSPEYMDEFRRLIKRDRNHPSIIMWSIGNEEGYVQTTDIGKRIATRMLNELKKLDPTRTATYAADLPNVRKGINEIIPIRGFNYREFAMDEYHKDHPDQPIVGTEMGSTVTTRGIYVKDSIRGYVPDQDITHPWWASLAETWWKIAAENQNIMGGYIWTGFDYRGEPTPYEWPNINSHFGVMDMCGFPKNIYYYYQSWWTDKDVLHISPHWNWEGKEGENIEVWVNSNAQNVELFLNGKSLGKKIMERNSHLKWLVPYKKGVLKAVAFKDGRRIEAKVETTDAPYKIVLTPDRKIIHADGKDLGIFNISVVDKKGREVPTANNLIKFQIEGDAKAIGVGNGDPSSHEPDRFLDNNYQRSLFNGKAQLIVQARKIPGNILIKVISENLISGELLIKSE